MRTNSRLSMAPIALALLLIIAGCGGGGLDSLTNLLNTTDLTNTTNTSGQSTTTVGGSEVTVTCTDTANQSQGVENVQVAGVGSDAICAIDPTFAYCPTFTTIGNLSGTGWGAPTLRAGTSATVNVRPLSIDFENVVVIAQGYLSSRPLSRSSTFFSRRSPLRRARSSAISAARSARSPRTAPT